MITLPDPPKAPLEGKSLPQTEPSAQPLILLVDDHEDTRGLIKFLLERQGYRIMEAEDGEAAIAQATRERPALVLMDLGLPKLDGLEAMQRLREGSDLHNPPVVFLSAHAEAAYRDQAFAAGGDAYLVKPIDIEQLLRVVQQYVFLENKVPVATRC